MLKLYIASLSDYNAGIHHGIWAAFARDLEIDGYHITDNGHVFCNN